MSSTEILHIGKYDVVGVLGRGGMGVVYSAVDKRIGRKVAIKTLTKGFVGDPEMLARFYEEAKRTGRLTHPNIVTVYDLGDHDGVPYIVMECVEGEPLDKIIRANTRLPLVSRLRIVEEVCCALGYAHQNNVIHRDVKPANIFVQNDGVTKLLDFGIARLEKRETSSGHTRTGHIIGTVPYMAPERLRDEEIDGRSDIFSAGVVLYQLITGHLPFNGEDVIVAARILNDQHAPLSTYLSDYPRSLDNVLDRSLAKDPLDRFMTAEEMATELSSIMAELRQEEVLELFPQAQRYVESRQFTEARAILQQLLRIDTKHSGAKQLLAEIQQQFARRNRQERVQQICAQAQEAMREKRFDEGINLLQEGLRIDSANIEVSSLLELAQQEKQKRDRIEEFLREADTARRKGDFGGAIAAAQKALNVDKSNSKVVSVFNLLVREAEASEKRASARKLLEAARGEIASYRFAEAIELLKEAEKLATGEPELALLLADAHAGLEQTRHKRLLSELKERVMLASTYEELQSAAAEVQRALDTMPAEAALFHMKAELDRQLKEHRNQQVVEDTIQACRSLPLREALEHVRLALLQLPGTERLLFLESNLKERVAQQSVEERRAEYLLRARDALKKSQYSEAERILENCQAEGIGSTETRALLEFTQREEAAHRRLVVLQSSLVTAQALVRSESYDEAIALLQPLTGQIDDPALHHLLAQARAARDTQQEQAEELLISANRTLRERGADDALRMLQSQPASILQLPRIQIALAALEEEQNRERFRSIGEAYAGLDRDIVRGDSLLEGALSGLGKSLQSMRSSFAQRKSVFADASVGASISEARGSLRSGYRQVAFEQLQSSSAALEYASPALQAQWRQLQREAGKAGVVDKLKQRLAK